MKLLLAALPFLIFCACQHDNAVVRKDASLTAMDKISIMETAAQFDNGLDKEDLSEFENALTPDGTLNLNGVEFKGRPQVEKSFYYMLSTFAKGKRHCVSNHIITGDSSKAQMESYLSVVNRNDLKRGGSAIQHDKLAKVNGEWKITYRKIDIDSSFMSKDK